MVKPKDAMTREEAEALIATSNAVVKFKHLNDALNLVRDGFNSDRSRIAALERAAEDRLALLEEIVADLRRQLEADR